MNDTSTITPSSLPDATLYPGSQNSNGLAIAAMIVGIVAFVSGLIPFWGILAGATAIVLGIIGLRKAGAKGMSIVGIIGGSLALLTSLITSALLIIGIMNSPTTQNTTGSLAEKLLAEKKDYAVGETMYFNGWAVKIDAIERTTNEYEKQFAKFSNGDPGEDRSLAIFLAKYKEYDYITVTLTVTNTDIPTEDLPFLMDNAFNLTDGTTDFGFPIRPVDVPEPEFTTQSYEIGESQTGSMVFEIPKDKSGGDLKLLVDLKTYLNNYPDKSKTLRYTLDLE